MANFAGNLLPGKLVRHLLVNTTCWSPVVQPIQHWQYPPIDHSQDQQYFECGFTAVFDVPPRAVRPGSEEWSAWAKGSAIWHTSNKYTPRHLELLREDEERAAAHRLLVGAGEGGVSDKGAGGGRSRAGLGPLPGGFFELEASLVGLVREAQAIRAG